MGKMAELSDLIDKYGQRDYVEYLEDKIELLFEERRNHEALHTNTKKRQNKKEKKTSIH